MEVRRAKKAVYWRLSVSYQVRGGVLDDDGPGTAGQPAGGQVPGQGHGYCRLRGRPG